MQAEIAKHNPTIHKLAVLHYLNQLAPPIFTFMSLWNDEEPYPLDEVIEVQKARITHLQAEAEQYPNSESIKTLLFTAKKNLARLIQKHDHLSRIKGKTTDKKEGNTNAIN